MDRRPTICVESHRSKHEYADSFCSLAVEGSDTDSEEELGTAVEAHYHMPRRVGFGVADNDHMDIFECSRDCHETMELSLYHCKRSLSAYQSSPALAAPYDPWNSHSSTEGSYGTSSVYFDAKEFPDIDANSSGAVRGDAQLYATANWQTMDGSAENAPTDTLNLGILGLPMCPGCDLNLDELALGLPQCPGCTTGKHSRVLPSEQGAESSLDGSKNPAFFEAASVVSQSPYNRNGKGATKKLRHKIENVRIQPEQNRNWPMTTGKNAFWGKWRRTWSKLTS